LQLTRSDVKIGLARRHGNRLNVASITGQVAGLTWRMASLYTLHYLGG